MYPTLCWILGIQKQIRTLSIYPPGAQFNGVIMGWVVHWYTFTVQHHGGGHRNKHNLYQESGKPFPRSWWLSWVLKAEGFSGLMEGDDRAKALSVKSLCKSTGARSKLVYLWLGMWSERKEQWLEMKLGGREQKMTWCIFPISYFNSSTDETRGILPFQW